MSITNLLKINHNTHVKRNVIKTLYSKSKSGTKTLLSLHASDDGYIVCYNSINQIYLNYNNHVSVAENEGKFSKNAVYFPGHKDQKLVIDNNIFYGLNEFTITTWIKTENNTINPMTLVEVVPKIFIDCKEDMDIKSKLETTINDFKNIYDQTKSENAINIGVYKQNISYELNIKHQDIQDFDNEYWNHIMLTYKDNIFYLFINGKLTNTGTLDTDEFLHMGKSMYTIIGSSFFDNNSNLDEVYIDDFVIYDKALFTSDFKVPNTYMFPNYNNTGIKFDTCYIYRKTEQIIARDPVYRNVVKTYTFTFDCNYYCYNRNYVKIFKFIF